MRMFLGLLLLPLFGAPALAEPAPDHHGRRGAVQHFADANTTHDGRLTLDQAATGYKSIAKSFNQIDTARRGYVTLDDIKAWKAAKKAAKQAAAAASAPRPNPAPPRGAGSRAMDTPPDLAVPASTGAPRTGVDILVAPLDGTRRS